MPRTRFVRVGLGFAIIPTGGQERFSLLRAARALWPWSSPWRIKVLMTACLLTLRSLAALSSSSSMEAVKSTFTRWMGLRIAPEPVKKRETSLPPPLPSLRCHPEPAAFWRGEGPAFSLPLPLPLPLPSPPRCHPEPAALWRCEGPAFRASCSSCFCHPEPARAVKRTSVRDLLFGPLLFSHHNPVWGYLFACSIALLVALMAWTQIKDKYEAEHQSQTLQHSSVAFVDPAISRYMGFSGVFKEGQLPLVEISYVVSGPVPITHRGLHVDVSLKSIEQNPALLIEQAVEDFRKSPLVDKAELVFPPGEDVKRTTGAFPPDPKPLTSEEAAQLNSGRLAICVIAVLHWDDKSGSYETTLSRCHAKFPVPNALMWAAFPGDNVEHKR